MLDRSAETAFAAVLGAENTCVEKERRQLRRRPAHMVQPPRLDLLAQPARLGLPEMPAVVPAENHGNFAQAVAGGDGPLTLALSAAVPMAKPRERDDATRDPGDAEPAEPTASTV